MPGAMGRGHARAVRILRIPLVEWSLEIVSSYHQQSWEGGTSTVPTCICGNADCLVNPTQRQKMLVDDVGVAFSWL
jgi:hypothetical protein